MAEQTVSILATLRDQVSGPLGKIVGGFGALQGSLANVRSKLAPVSSGLGSLIGTLLAVGEARKSIAAAEAQADAEVRLLSALRGRRDLLQQISRLSSEIQGVTTFGDETITEVAAQLVNAGVAVGDLNDLLRLTTDISAGTGVNLKSVARGLALLNQGESAGSLARIVPELRELVKESDSGATALALLKSRFGGVAQELAKTDFGKAKQAINAIGDEEERLGFVLVKVKVAILTGLIPAFRSLADALESTFGKEVIAALTQVLNFALQFSPLIISVVAAAKAFSFASWIGGLIGALAPVAGVAAVIFAIVAALQAAGVEWGVIGDAVKVVWDQVVALGRAFFNNAKTAEDLFDVLKTRALQTGNLFKLFGTTVKLQFDTIFKLVVSLGKGSAAGLKIAFFGIVVAVAFAFEKLIGAVTKGVDAITNSTADLLLKLPGVSKEVADSIRTNFEASAPKFEIGRESLQEALNDAKEVGKDVASLAPNLLIQTSLAISRATNANRTLENELDARQKARENERVKVQDDKLAAEAAKELKSKTDTADQITQLEARLAKVLEGKDKEGLQRKRERRLAELEKSYDAELISFDAFITEKRELEIAPINEAIAARQQIIDKLELERQALIANKGELQDILAKTQQLVDLQAQQTADRDEITAKDKEIAAARIAQDRKVLKAAKDSIDELLKSAEAARDRFDDRVASIKDRVNRGFLFPSEGAEKESEAVESLDKALQRYGERIDEIITKHPELASEIGRVSEEMLILETRIEQSTQTFEDFERGFVAGARNIIAEGANLREAGLSIGRTFVTDVSGAIVDSIVEADFSWREFAANFLKLIAKMILQLALFRGLSSALGIPVGFNSGGLVAGFASGGRVPGPRVNRDIVNARLTPNEFVQPVAAVDYYGVGAMEAIRRRLIPRAALKGYTMSSVPNVGGGYNTGGSVRDAASGGSTLVANEQTLERLLAGGKRAFLRHLGDNASEYRAALQR